MRKYIDILNEMIGEDVDRENDQQYLMDFFKSCMFLAQRHNTKAAFGAKVFIALAQKNMTDRLEAMFNDELLPYLAARGYPDEGSPEWSAAQNDVIQHFYDKKREDYDLTGL